MWLFTLFKVLCVGSNGYYKNYGEVAVDVVATTVRFMGGLVIPSSDTVILAVPTPIPSTNPEPAPLGTKVTIV